MEIILEQLAEAIGQAMGPIAGELAELAADTALIGIRVDALQDQVASLQNQVASLEILTIVVLIFVAGIGGVGLILWYKFYQIEKQIEKLIKEKSKLSTR